MARARRSSLGPGSVLTVSGSRRGRSRRPAPRLWVLAVLALLLGAGGYVAAELRSRAADRDAQRAAAQRFTAAWGRLDVAAMWRELTPAARARYPRERFAGLYRTANTNAGVEAVRLRRGAATRPCVAVRTRDFGTLRGCISLPVSGSGDDAGVDWRPQLRLPGLRQGEAPQVRRGEQPARGQILAANGEPLAADPLGASIAGKPGPPPSGLHRLYDKRVGGRASSRLIFGLRVVREVPARRGRTLRTTIRPGLQRAAQAALGDKLGGIAVVRPRDGAVLALAGLAVSAPQPPGSVFKVITLASALEHGVARPSSSYPVTTHAVLSGRRLSNAGGESCGGSLANSFAHSCNSVFAPMGAKLGARRLLAAARDFGLGDRLAIPAVKPSRIGPELRDSLAVGSAAIGQDRDLATPLAMAAMTATIANDGVYVRPHLATIDRPVRRRAVSRKVAGQVRDMMAGVVRGGTGKAAALPGVTVAGKTGTAELRPGSRDPKDANAWFVAFAPAGKPKVAVAVMLVGAGFGGTTAAPVAKQVLAAALR